MKQVFRNRLPRHQFKRPGCSVPFSDQTASCSWLEDLDGLSGGRLSIRDLAAGEPAARTSPSSIHYGTGGSRRCISLEYECPVFSAARLG